VHKVHLTKDDRRVIADCSSADAQQQDVKKNLDADDYGVAEWNALFVRFLSHRVG
jgi:hypothetical protein